jgi:cysteine-rich repeat protein
MQRERARIARRIVFVSPGNSWRGSDFGGTWRPSSGADWARCPTSRRHFEIRKRAVLGLVLASTLAAGCPGPTTPRDAGRLDTGTTDTGTTDTGMTDTGMVVTDTGGGNCGNGAIDTGEECDGANLDGETCVSQGHAGGTISCNAACQLDESACTEDPCGNGALDAGEDCDGAMLGTGTCVSEGFVSGALRCAADCTYDTATCSACGDGGIDAGEACDGTALGTNTCVTLGYTGGTLACNADCTLNEAACVNAACGNAMLEAGEDCDGTRFPAGTSCTTFGFALGTLSCNADCTTNTAACTDCGNGAINGVEACDGTAFGTRTCVTEGFTMGSLACTPTCTLNTSGCSIGACGNGAVEAGETCDDGNVSAGDGCSATCAPETGYACTGMPSSCDPVCGDGAIVGGETCDGTNFGGATCTSLGFVGGGTLACSATTCLRNTSGCLATNCGNGTVNTGEECDDSNTVALDGCSPSCQIEATFNLPVRLVGTVGTSGRVEVRFGGAWRDVCDDGLSTGPTPVTSTFATTVCRQMGFTGTGHRVFTIGGGSATPVMDNVVCTGTEPNLSQCSFNGWGIENCNGDEAIGVTCVPAEGDVRLAGGTDSMSGRLQVFHLGAWGEVCDDIFETSRYGMTTVCQQLGYRSGVNSNAFSAPGDVFALDNLTCTGTERRVASCSHNAFFDENCVGAEAQGVVCTEYREGDTRVVGGSGRNNGRLEVLHQNIWGTVCDDLLETPTSTTAMNFSGVSCRQLGFTGGASLTTGFADGPDPIVLDDLMCVGTETALLMCPARAFGTHNCSHPEDVGLNCTP